MDQPVATFRSAFFPVWRVTTTLASAEVAGVLAVFGLVLGIPVQVPQIFVTAACAIVTGGLLAGLIAYYRVYVTSEGIKGFDFFCFYHLARWESVKEARPINLLGLRYLRVFSTDASRPLWVPLFLSDMSGFRETVCRHAEPNNPLLKSLPIEASRTSRST